MHPEFKVHILNTAGVNMAKSVSEKYDALLSDLEKFITPSREFSIVKTKLEEFCFFAKKSIASMECYQLEENS